MTERRDNVLIVHWHDLGRYLGTYGHTDVSSPRLDQLAAESILFTRAHATAPLCSPSRGSLFTGRYPQNNGLVGLAHHGWEYRAGVRTLPHILSESGWYTALFGMQHETSYPSKLGFDEFDVSNSYCEYVVEHATRWLTDPPKQPFLLTAGFFETHRPYPRDRYEPADADDVVVPDYLPDTHDIRQDLAEFYGSISVADAAVGRLLDTLDHTGLDRITWVVFMTDHGPALPRAKSTLYDAGTGIAMIVRPPRNAAHEPQVYDELFSGVDLLPTLLDLLGVDIPAEIDGMSHARDLRTAPRRQVRCAPRSTPRRRITIRSIRFAPSGQRNTATSRTTRHGRCSICRGISPKARPAGPWRHCCSTSDQRANCTTSSRIRRSRTTCWGPTPRTRQKRSPTISRCSSTTGARKPTTSYPPNSRAPESRSATPKPICVFTVHSSPAASAIAAERGIEDDHGPGQ